MSTGGIGTYYERLGAWNRVARAFGYGGGDSTLTVHRALADPVAGGRPTHTRLHDILLEHLDQPRGARVLDAGCGLGGTMIDLSQRAGATCEGLTLSAGQAARANDEAARRGLAGRVHASVGSYDDPPPGPFDVIVAIESLAHSPDPAVSLAALVRSLAPGGRLAIVDDMPLPGAEADPDLARFKRGWQCPVLWSAGAWRAAFDTLGLRLELDRDLSAECRPRGRVAATALLALNRLVHAFAPAGLRAVLDSHQGGLALERLARRGRVEYRLLIARRPSLQVS